MKRECVPRTDCIKSERITVNIHLTQSIAAGSNKLEKRVVKILKDLRSRMEIQYFMTKSRDVIFSQIFYEPKVAVQKTILPV